MAAGHTGEYSFYVFSPTVRTFIHGQICQLIPLIIKVDVGTPTFLAAIVFQSFQCVISSTLYTLCRYLILQPFVNLLSEPDQRWNYHQWDKSEYQGGGHAHGTKVAVLGENSFPDATCSTDREFHSDR